jgi:hypothetical protein
MTEYLIPTRDNGKDVASDRQALALNPSPREVDSMYQQAVKVASITGDEVAGDRLFALFRGGVS